MLLSHSQRIICINYYISDSAEKKSYWENYQCTLIKTDVKCDVEFNREGEKEAKKIRQKKICPPESLKGKSFFSSLSPRRFSYNLEDQSRDSYRGSQFLWLLLDVTCWFQSIPHSGGIADSRSACLILFLVAFIEAHLILLLEFPSDTWKSAVDSPVEIKSPGSRESIYNGYDELSATSTFL